jgi:hypothetical protein
MKFDLYKPKFVEVAPHPQPTKTPNIWEKTKQNSRINIVNEKLISLLRLHSGYVLKNVTICKLLELCHS